MKVVIINYNAGNTRSVSYGLERLGIGATLSDDPAVIRAADKVIFPGVGAAGPAMSYLKEKGLHKVITQLQQPVLGICLGMQLMCNHSEEGNVDCLGIFDTEVKKFVGDIKIPHMGWNNITGLSAPLFKGISEGAFMYFVHSYYIPLCDHTISTTNYAGNYSSAIQKDNFYAVQFHPEKSGTDGQQILQNFINL